MKTKILCRVCGAYSDLRADGVAKCPRCGSWNAKVSAKPNRAEINHAAGQSIREQCEGGQI